MQEKKAKLVFFGNERLATGVTTTAPTLQALIENGYEICRVVVAQSEKSHNSRKQRELEIRSVAEKHDIPVLSPAKLSEIKDELKECGAEAGILISYGRVVPEEIINLFPKGIINIHPSLLPRHRGPTPIESVILLGSKETGVSLMQLTPVLDAGPVYAQDTLPLQGDETKQALADKLLNMGKDMLIANLPGILDGSLKPEPQSNMEHTQDPKINTDNSQLDFQKPASQLEREVRAYAGWPRSRVMLGTTEVIVTHAHAIDVNGVAGTIWISEKELGIHAAEGTLIIDSLIPPGKKEMPAAAYLAGYSPMS